MGERDDLDLLQRVASESVSAKLKSAASKVYATLAWVSTEPSDAVGTVLAPATAEPCRSIATRLASLDVQSGFVALLFL